MYINVSLNIKTAILVGIISGLICTVLEKNKEIEELQRTKGE